MRGLLRRVALRMAEPRVATALSLGAYATLFLLSFVLIVHGSSSGFGSWTYIPPVLMMVGALVAAPSAWRGGYWGWNVEQLGLILTAGGLMSGVVVEVYDLFLEGDAVSYYLIALLFGFGAMVFVRSWFLTAQSRALRRFSLRVPLYFVE